MKVTILAAGSRGDVQPIVALGEGLSRSSYSVRLVTLESFEPLVRQAGLDFFPIAGDAHALTVTMMQGMAGNGLNLLRMYRGIMRSFGAITRHYARTFASDALRDSDAILNQLPGGFYGYDLAERLEVPYMALSVIPQESTSAWPMPLLPSRISLGRGYNRLTYPFAQQLAWQPFRASINRFRDELNLPPTSFWWGNMRRMTQQRMPVVQGFSRHVVPTPTDWGDHVYTTGYWFLDEKEWQPPADLLAFLEAGERPVFIGFGSMPVSDPQETTVMVLKALAETGQRGILHAGWAGLGQQPLPNTVYRLEYAPYSWLFPQMAAIVHHGGSGTTGLALQSGVPSLVVPFTADQPFWGQRTQALGVGPAPIPFSRLTTAALASAIDELVRSRQMQDRARQMRTALAEEKGVDRAVEIIDQYLSR